MAKPTLTSAPKDAQINHTGHTSSGKFGTDPNKQAARGNVTKLSK